MRKKGGIINAQPLPSHQGEGQGWGQYLIRYQDITAPTPPKGHPSPTREGRGWRDSSKTILTF